MSTRRAILVLEGVPPLPMAGEGEYVVRRAASPLEAARALASSRPAFIVYRGDSAWQRMFVARLPPERRPAALGLGDGTLAGAHIADEWFAAAPGAEELSLRLKLAAVRARGRRQTARRAFVDHLTGLPNRRAVVRALVRESERARRNGGTLSLVLLDLDDFKQVNERDGHDAGDRLLRKVGAALRRATRTDEVCGRIGGDEFAMVVAGGIDDAIHAAERAKQGLRAIGVSASSGACELGPRENLKALYRRADKGLKAAKVRRHGPFSGRRPPETARTALPVAVQHMDSELPEQEVASEQVD